MVDIQKAIQDAFPNAEVEISTKVYPMQFPYIKLTAKVTIDDKVYNSTAYINTQIINVSTLDAIHSIISDIVVQIG